MLLHRMPVKLHLRKPNTLQEPGKRRPLRQAQKTAFPAARDGSGSSPFSPPDGGNILFCYLHPCKGRRQNGGRRGKAREAAAGERRSCLETFSLLITANQKTRSVTVDLRLNRPDALTPHGTKGVPPRKTGPNRPAGSLVWALSGSSRSSLRKPPQRYR